VILLIQKFYHSNLQRKDIRKHIGNLIESVRFNKGKDKLYLGVAGNLFAFACKLSFDKGYEGFVAFFSKTKLIDHYTKTLKAQNIGGLQMVLDTLAAGKLISKYYNK